MTPIKYVYTHIWILFGDQINDILVEILVTVFFYLVEAFLHQRLDNTDMHTYIDLLGFIVLLLASPKVWHRVEH